MSGIDELAESARAARTERPDTPLAVATLYAVDGSSYRQPGARLLVDADGRVLAGAISGGCLEGDVASHAKGVCESGVPKLLTYDLREDLQSIWGYGAMCDGVAHVILEPIDQTSWLESAHAVRRERRSGSLITIIDSTMAGTCDRESAVPALLQAAAALLDIAAQTALPSFGDVVVDGHACRCLVDPLVPPVSLILIGAGRGAQAFAVIARTLGWTVTVIDHRPFVLESVSLPAGVARVSARAEHGLSQITVDGRTAVALLTHQFMIDAEWLSLLLPLSIEYIGVLGSRLRADQLVEKLEADGMEVTPRMKRMLHAPIGLDLGGETPESIALAAIAEIESVMHGRPGGPLRERHSPIHTRTPTPHVHS